VVNCPLKTQESDLSITPTPEPPQSRVVRGGTQGCSLHTQAKGIGTLAMVLSHTAGRERAVNSKPGHALSGQLQQAQRIVLALILTAIGHSLHRY